MWVPESWWRSSFGHRRGRELRTTEVFDLRKWSVMHYCARSPRSAPTLPALQELCHALQKLSFIDSVAPDWWTLRLHLVNIPNGVAHTWEQLEETLNGLWKVVCRNDSHLSSAGDEKSSLISNPCKAFIVPLRLSCSDDVECAIAITLCQLYWWAGFFQNVWNSNVFLRSSQWMQYL